MDIQTNIIGLVILLLCLLPFFLMRIKNEKKRKQSFQVLVNIAISHLSLIEKSAFWNKSVIGIDTATRMLFFSKNADDRDSYTAIDLSKIQKCQLVISKNNTKLVDKLELKLESFDSSKPDTTLEFYNNSQAVLLVNELELLKKWHAIVNENL